MAIGRRVLTGVAGLGVALLLACGNNSDEEEGSFSISDNHLGQEHSIAITLDDLADAQASGSKDFNIQGLARHNHTVTFTLAELQQLQQGLRVSKASSFALDGDRLHQHQVTVFRFSE